MFVATTVSNESSSEGMFGALNLVASVGAGVARGKGKAQIDAAYDPAPGTAEDRVYENIAFGP